MASQVGCDVLVLVIDILSIKVFKISYLHKYWCFLSNSKMQKLFTSCAREAWRDSRKHWHSFGYVVAAQIGCDVLVLAIAILLIKNFKISYLHKYWCFLSILKCKSYLLAERTKHWRDSRKHWQSFGYVVASQNMLWCFGPCYCHIVNKKFQNIISPQVLMLFEYFKMQKLSTCWAKDGLKRL